MRALLTRPGRPWLLLPVALAAAVATITYPGRWTPDSFGYFDGVRTGQFDDWYSPIVSAILRVGYLIYPLPGVVLYLQLLLLAAGTYVLARSVLAPAGAAVTACAVILNPGVLSWLIAISRDVWCGVSYLAFVALAQVALWRAPGRAAKATAWAGAGGFLFVFVATRQNAFAGAFVPLAAVAAELLARHRPGLRTRLRVTAAAALSLAAVTLLLGVRHVATYEVLGSQRAHPEVVLEIQDVAAISVRRGRLLFDPAILQPSRLPALEAAFDPNTVDAIAGRGQLIPASFRPAVRGRLRENWLDAITSYPLDYAAVRFRLFTELVGARGEHPTYTVPYTEGSVSLGVLPRHPSWNRAIDEYLGVYESSPLQRAVLYAGAVLLALVLARRRAPAERFLAWSALGSVVYVAGFLVVAPVTDNRFNWTLIVMGSICACTSLGQTLRDRPPRFAAPGAGTGQRD